MLQLVRRLAVHGASLAAAFAVSSGLPIRAAGQETTTLESVVAGATDAVVLIDVETPSDKRQGSGFIVDPVGLIITNDHVVRDARSARVKLASGDVYDRVAILAQDERRDIAILRIPGFDLPTLPMGNSDSLRIGASLVLIGSPLGLENTVSTGVLSGRRKEPEGFELLQITAPASNGSSGGAVLTAGGQVIAIATSQLTMGQNLNFAVPINYARGLLQNLTQDPLVVLQPTSGRSGDAAATPQPRVAADRVNAGLTFDLAGLRGWMIETAEDVRDVERKRGRTTYRLIETVGATAPRIERYYESETTRRTEPFGTWQTVARERVRSLVAVDGLRPISSRGEYSWWTEAGWRSAEHDVRFEGDRVLGAVTDTAGRTLELDRAMPSGVLLRDVADLAFATLQADSLMGRSVEFTTFDPRAGEVAVDRFDIIRAEEIDVADTRRAVFEVNVASGLTNETVYYLQRRPRIAVRRVSQDGSRVEEVTLLEMR
ncbi:MAG: S1C family serine protease [Gemmatimonadales bacterium]